MFINIYNTLIRLLYPVAIKRYIKKRQENGKEDMKRFNERIGKPLLKRPEAASSGFTAHPSASPFPCCR